MSHFRVMNGNDCYGVANTRKSADEIISMHKNSKTGNKAPSKASTLDFRVESVEGDYPTDFTFKIGYKPG